MAPREKTQRDVGSLEWWRNQPFASSTPPCTYGDPSDRHLRHWRVVDVNAGDAAVGLWLENLGSARAQGETSIRTWLASAALLVRKGQFARLLHLVAVCARLVGQHVHKVVDVLEFARASGAHLEAGRVKKTGSGNVGIL